MEPRITPDDFDREMEQAHKDQQTYPDDFRPNRRMVAARNMIQDCIGSSMGAAQSVEMTPLNQTEDGVWYGITVVMKPGRNTIPTRVNLIAGYAGLEVHVLESGEAPDDVDEGELDDEERPQLKFRLVR